MFAILLIIGLFLLYISITHLQRGILLSLGVLCCTLRSYTLLLLSSYELCRILPSSQSDKGAYDKGKGEGEDTIHRMSSDDVVSVSTGVSFIGISLIGLNGEQLLDVMMAVRIWDDYFSGSKV